MKLILYLVILKLRRQKLARHHCYEYLMTRNLFWKIFSSLNSNLKRWLWNPVGHLHLLVMILTIFPLFNYSWTYYWISDFWVQKNEVCWDSRETSRFVDAPGPHRHQPRHYVSCHGNHNVYNDNNHSSLDVMCLIVSGFSATVCRSFEEKK